MVIRILDSNNFLLFLYNWCKCGVIIIGNSLNRNLMEVS